VTPFVIAEFAGCHDGVLHQMLAGIGVAKWTGANAFKTAWTSSAVEAAKRMHLDDPAPLRVVQWPREWFPQIRAACTEAGLEFLCTVDLEADIAVVAPYVDRFKIASWGAMDLEFFHAHKRVDQHKPLIRSLGITTSKNLDVIEGMADWDLHCVSAYPTPMADCNLAAIRAEDLDGFSDHTCNTITGALAVAAGAKVLEVHFALTETNPKNPDRVVSLMPWELQSYIAGARLAALALGDGVKKIMPSEAANVRHRYV